MYISCTLIPHATLLTAWSVSSQSKLIKSFFATYLPSELSLDTSCSTQQSAETLHGSASASRPQAHPNCCIYFCVGQGRGTGGRVAGHPLCFKQRGKNGGEICSTAAIKKRLLPSSAPGTPPPPPPPGAGSRTWLRHHPLQINDQQTGL